MVRWPPNIPELGTADPSWFGIALSTLDGHVYEVGDVHREFTIQSVSKPFVYALALADRGLDEVLRWVGVEPSGEAFNSIRLDGDTGWPLNPVVNAGAIVTASLADGGTAGERFARILAGLSEFAGRELEVDEGVYTSESRTGDRNRALAYLMHGTGALRCGVEDALRVYFGQCSVLVTAHDLAVMAATIAAGGVHPVTGRVVVSPAVAQHVLTSAPRSSSARTSCSVSGTWSARQPCLLPSRTFSATSRLPRRNGWRTRIRPVSPRCRRQSRTIWRSGCGRPRSDNPAYLYSHLV